jgi:hypothetical protein
MRSEVALGHRTDGWVDLVEGLPLVGLIHLLHQDLNFIKCLLVFISFLNPMGKDFCYIRRFNRIHVML